MSGSNLLDLHTDFSGSRWGGLLLTQFAVIRAVKGFVIVNNTEIDVFLELSCCFCDPTDVDSKRDFAPPTILLGLLLCPRMWGILF